MASTLVKLPVEREALVAALVEREALPSDSEVER